MDLNLVTRRGPVLVAQVVDGRLVLPPAPAAHPATPAPAPPPPPAPR